MSSRGRSGGKGAVEKQTDRKSAGSQQAGPSRSGNSRAIVPKGQQGVMASQRGGRAVPGQSSIIAPVGYKMRPVQAAKNYDVISFARAMNDDFGPRVKKLFDTEREAALQAQHTGIYIGWRCPEFKHDCQRVGDSSKCFCGHLLNEHAPYNAKSFRVPCKGGCKCKAFAWIPSKPEEVGEFWFQRRRNFDPSTWRAKCRCKHTHEEHDPTGIHRCKKCGCGAFDSNFLCAACDKHWENHETFFENAQERKEKGLPIGADYLPFAEIPALRNMVLTGEDNEDMSYMAQISPPYDPEMKALPPSAAPADNSSVVPFGNSSNNSHASKKSGFRPVYD